MTMVSDTDIVTVSVGVATVVPRATSCPSVLLYQAEEAMLRAKQEGRNCVRLYDDYTEQSRSATNLHVATESLRTYETVGRKL
jgi:predicted signal transduction protein with EAL and GGDEF domain